MNLFLFALTCLTVLPDSLTPASIIGQSHMSETQCTLLELRTIKGEKDQVIDTYCRCNDGSYGFSCKERHPNPCIGNVRFEISPDNIPDNYFVHCDNNVPYLFKCPASTKWNHSLFTCSSLEINPSEYMELFQEYVEKKTGRSKVQKWNDTRKLKDFEKFKMLENELNEMFEFEHNLQQKITETDNSRFDHSRNIIDEDQALKIVEAIKYDDMESYSGEKIEWILNHLNNYLINKNKKGLRNSLSRNIQMEGQQSKRNDAMTQIPELNKRKDTTGMSSKYEGNIKPKLFQEFINNGFGSGMNSNGVQLPKADSLGSMGYGNQVPQGHSSSSFGNGMNSNGVQLPKADSLGSMGYGNQVPQGHSSSSFGNGMTSFSQSNPRTQIEQTIYDHSDSHIENRHIPILDELKNDFNFLRIKEIADKLQAHLSILPQSSKKIDQKFENMMFPTSSVLIQNNKMVSNLLPLQIFKDEATILAEINVCKTISKNLPIVYEVEMPQALTKSDSSNSFNLLVDSLGRFSAQGIQILLKFPHE